MIPEQRTFLEQNARWRPDDVALRAVDTGETLTYGQFDAKANRFANALHDRGLRQGDRVAIALYNTVEFPIALYACHKRGVIPVALNYRSSEADFRYVFDELNPGAVVYDVEIADRVEGAVASQQRSLQLISARGESDGGEPFADFVASGANETPPEFIRDDDDISYMFYTSGTTGRPKAVAHSNTSGYNRMVTSIMANQNNPQTVCLLLFPFFHGGGMDSTLRAVVATGAELILMRSVDNDEALEAIEKYEVTDVRSVPTTAKRIADRPDIDEWDCSSIDCWRSTGAVFTESLTRTFMENVTPNLFNVYGSSEGGSNVVLRPEDLPEHAGTVGRPTVGTEVRIIEHVPGRDVSPDETVPRGEDGEVILKSEQLFHSYYENGAATRARVRDGWYYTHDIGYLSDDGYLTIKGRTDDMILSGGELISAVEVEEVLEAHEEVLESVVVGQPDEEWGQKVVAFVAPVEDCDPEDLGADLEEYCRSRSGLARYKRPREYEIVGDIEHNETGKKVRATYQQRVAE